MSGVLAERLTPEIRQKAMEKSLEARRNRVRANVRDDFADSPVWEQLASDAGVRLPIKGQVATVSKVKAWLRKIGVDWRLYVEWMGCKNIKEAVSLNPTWSLRAIAGLILEHRDQMLSLQKL